MLLPDNISPYNSIYYYGSLIISAFDSDETIALMDLYYRLKNNHSISFFSFILSLDWLFLIDYIYIDSQGEVKKCI